MSSRTRISSSTIRILDLGMGRFLCDGRCSVRRCVLPAESQLHHGATRGVTLTKASELLDQGSNQAPAQGARALEIDLGGHADPIVPDHEAELVPCGGEAAAPHARVTEGGGGLQRGG